MLFRSSRLAIATTTAATFTTRTITTTLATAATAVAATIVALATTTLFRGWFGITACEEVLQPSEETATGALGGFQLWLRNIDFDRFRCARTAFNVVTVATFATGATFATSITTTFTTRAAFVTTFTTRGAFGPVFALAFAARFEGRTLVGGLGFGECWCFPTLGGGADLFRRQNIELGRFVGFFGFSGFDWSGGFDGFGSRGHRSFGLGGCWGGCRSRFGDGFRGCYRLGRRRCGFRFSGSKRVFVFGRVGHDLHGGRLVIADRRVGGCSWCPFGRLAFAARETRATSGAECEFGGGGGLCAGRLGGSVVRGGGALGAGRFLV